MTNYTNYKTDNAIIMLEKYLYARHLADILKIEKSVSLCSENRVQGKKSHFQQLEKAARFPLREHLWAHSSHF